MTIQIDLKNDASLKWAFVVQLLRSLDFVENVQLKDEPVKTSTNKQLAELLLKGPTMNQDDEKYYEQKQKHFQSWN